MLPAVFVYSFSPLECPGASARASLCSRLQRPGCPLQTKVIKTVQLELDKFVSDKYGGQQSLKI